MESILANYSQHETIYWIVKKVMSHLKKNSRYSLRDYIGFLYTKRKLIKRRKNVLIAQIFIESKEEVY